MAFPEISQQDVWWRHVQPDNPLPALALGAKIKQDMLQYGIQLEDLKIRQQQAQAAAEEHVLKMQIQTQQMEGSRDLAGLGATIKDWSDPSVKNELMEFANKYPAIAGTPQWKAMVQFHEESVRRKAEIEKNKAQQQHWQSMEDIARQRAEGGTPQIKNLDKATELEAQAARIEEADPEQAKQLRGDAAILRQSTGGSTAPIRNVEQVFRYEDLAKEAEALGDTTKAKQFKESADMMRKSLAGHQPTPEDQANKKLWDASMTQYRSDLRSLEIQMKAELDALTPKQFKEQAKGIEDKYKALKAQAFSGLTNKIEAPVTESKPYEYKPRSEFDKVQVIEPPSEQFHNGRIGFVPVKELQEFLKRGYKIPEYTK